MDEYIELNRTFYELSADYMSDALKGDFDAKQVLSLRIGNDLDWNDLLKIPRLIILSEAGAGKTQEIRQITRKLRAQGKSAFFMRLEHLLDDLSLAFETDGTGTYEEFQNWIKSDNEGWIFLDSVDEARLKSPTDFEKAIKRLSIKMPLAMARAHITITSRVTAWRPKTDLELCNKLFPYTAPDEIEEKTEGTSFSVKSKEIAQQEKITTKKASKETTGFKIYSITDLSHEQIRCFANARGINSGKLLDEIERNEAGAFTTRPQDLEEVLAFWNENKRLGTRLELMKSSVDRRLKERDQNRSSVDPLTPDQTREGAQLIAAASTLMQIQSINIPDGGARSKGIEVKRVLSDWKEPQYLALLNRPLFDEALYSTVRFHHRSVREYLTSEWLFDLLKKQGSRARIEGLFFKNQYGLEVITPSMKPILSWLVLSDDKIRQKVYKLEPEIILEGGDPSKLDIETRKAILIAICQKWAHGTANDSVTDRASIQRFSSTDLSEQIISLLAEYKNQPEVVSFLLRMIWQGRISQALPQAKEYASNPKSGKYQRIAAFRAVKQIGNETDFWEVLNAFLLEPTPHDRRLFAEAINLLEKNSKSVTWILTVLKNVTDKERYSADGLTQALCEFISQLDPENIAVFIEGIQGFLREEPVIERRYCEISKRYAWLMNVSLKATEKLIEAKHPKALEDAALFTLCQAPAFHDFEEYESRTTKNNIPELISVWPELNHRLFWKDAEETRKTINRKKEAPLTNHWQVGIFGRYWGFKKEDFDLILKDISQRSLKDDKLVALSLAFELYKDSGRPKQQRKQLKEVVTGDPDFELKLKNLLKPPKQTDADQKWKKQQAQWKLRDQARERSRKEDEEKAKAFFSKNYETIRNSGLQKGTLSQNQYYLHEHMRSKSKDEDSSSWTNGNWQILIDEFDENVALAFRDSLLSFWREYKPDLRSENDRGNNTPIQIIYGLSGLSVASKEEDNWPANLSKENAELACRYAFCELNGFPEWFPKLYSSFPETVRTLILKEIDWELETETPKENRHYILDRVIWGCKWLWDDLAESLLGRLAKEPLNSQNLSNVLNIIQGSSKISDQTLAEISALKCKTSNSLESLAYWFSAWIGTAPEQAIKALTERLTETNDTEAAKNFAMNVIVNLIGERTNISSARNAFKTPAHLKQLYVLMHQYIKVSEDIERAGGGAFSPVLRDHAQEARSTLFSMLKEISGKESYLALSELSKMHPVEERRLWMQRCAKERAEEDADSEAWTDEKFNEFKKDLESTPTNHRELFELAVQRLEDLKHDLENGDNSIASILLNNKETGIRLFICGWCRDRAAGRYSIAQEEELSDSKRTDLRFLGTGFDGPVPIELKLSDGWGAPKFRERLENQLCGDYLRDEHSNRGIFLIVHRGDQQSWQIPNGNQKANFNELLEDLQAHWEAISSNYPKIEQIVVIGIDLTKRTSQGQTGHP
jgi:hypothetical protein